MKLIEALEIINYADLGPDAPVTIIFLACGFTPLHLKTYLAAHLRSRLPGQKITIHEGVYGDLAGNLSRLKAATSDASGVIIEWSDLDPRLGIRNAGNWRPRELPDILKTVKERLDGVSVLIKSAAKGGHLAICLPTLPLPPISISSGETASAFELELNQILASFAAHAAAIPRVRIVSNRRLDQLSPHAARLDVRSELISGFPYKLDHASTVGELLAALIAPPQPKKGLIVDLDDTLWQGTLGEVGVQEVSWDLDNHSRMHGLFQLLIQSLSESGVLVAAASRNDPAVVEEAFAREDMILDRDSVFPLEANWGRKSDSFARILDVWNVAPDSVVFVDNSPIELAEVKSVYPDAECHLFPSGDEQAQYALLETLRDLLGKDSVSEEDAIRAASIRGNQTMQNEARAVSISADGFLDQAQAKIEYSFSKDQPDTRAIELVNKTNQFNLNGRRVIDSAWAEKLRKPESFLLMISYEDKFGPLGRIAALAGRLEPDTICLDTWVMSCRAFGRRVEHKCLEILFDQLGPEKIVLDFQSTDRNGPIIELIAQLSGREPAPGITLTKKQFRQNCPPLFQQTMEKKNA